MKKKKPCGHLLPSPSGPQSPEPVLSETQFRQPIVSGAHGISEIQPIAAARCKPFSSAPKTRPFKAWSLKELSSVVLFFFFLKVGSASVIKKTFKIVRKK